MACSVERLRGRGTEGTGARSQEPGRTGAVEGTEGEAQDAQEGRLSSEAKRRLNRLYDYVYGGQSQIRV